MTDPFDPAGPAQGAPWWQTLSPAETEIGCGDGKHTVRWARGALTLPAHPDAEAELILGALGGEKAACAELAAIWGQHDDDLTVLSLGPRSAADQPDITWENIEAFRTSPAGSIQRRRAVGSRTAIRRLLGPGGTQGQAPGPIAYPGPPHPGAPAAGPRRPGPVVPASPLAPGGPLIPAPVPATPVPGAPVARPAMASPAVFGRPSVGDVQDRRVEVLTLFALGPAFRMRLAGTVAARWSAPDRAAARAAHRPALTAALTGRFAPAAQEWLGIDADQVIAVPHEGPGWGSLELAEAAGGPGTAGGLMGSGPAGGGPADGGLRASLPLAWLARVWACGLAVVDGHLVVAVQAARWPDAQVLALPGPGAAPVTLHVRADAGPGGPGADARWRVIG